MELLHIFIAAVVVFQGGLVAANNLPPIIISGNPDSVYPGDWVIFECHVDTTGIDLLTFQWVRIDGENVTFFDETVDMEISGSGSADDGNYFFNSTLNVTNVNYTDNNVGYYCNASGCNVSMTAYLTVMSPMITSFTPLPQLLLDVNNTGSLGCDALGGPRLVITIERDGIVVENGTMGNDRVVYNFTASNETFGNYTCTATIDDMQMNESMLVVVAPYDVTITADSGGVLMNRPAVVEYGNNLTLTCGTSGGPDNTFSWFKEDMSIGNTSILSISSVTPADGGVYQCMVSNDAGNSITNITIYVAPQFVMEPQGVETFIGSAVNVSCSARGFPVPVITWSFQAMPFNNDTVDSTNSPYSESTIVITSLMLSHGGTYSCNINSSALVMPRTSEAVVAVIGETVMGLMNTSVFPGQSATWVCRIQSSIPLQFTWYLDGQLAQNTTGSHMADMANSSYTLANSSYNNNGSNVTCSAAGNDLTVDSNGAAYLTVLLPTITDITIVPTPPSVGILLHQFNDDVSLTCTAEGGPRIMTRWQFDNGSTVANGSSSVTYNVSSLSTNHTGVYYCVAIIDGMIVTSMNYTLFVAPYNVMIMGVNLYNQGEQLQLNCLSEGGPELEYTWLFSGSMIPNANNNILVINNLITTDGGDYTCNVINAAGNSSSTVTVYIAPYNVMIMGDNLYNQGEQLMLNCLSEGRPELEYTWLFAGSVIPNANTSTLIINNLSTTDGGDYTCNVTNAAGNDNNIITVYIAPYDVMIMGDNLYNQGEQLQLNCLSEGRPELEYTWLFSGSMIPNACNNTLVINNLSTTDGGDYTCNVTNAAGNSSSSVTVYIAPYKVNIIGIRRYPYGSDIELNCTSEGGPELNYSWIFLDSIIDTDAMLMRDGVVAHGGNYTCNVTNNAGFDSNTTTVYIGPRFITDPVGSQEVVINGTFTLTCIAEGFPTPSIIWFMNGTMISNGVSNVTAMNVRNSTLRISNANFSDSGMYYCEAVSSEFSGLNVISGIVNITVVERPVVRLVTPPLPNVTLGSNVTFDCNEFGSPPFLYQWYMRDAITGIDILLVNETGEFYTIPSTMYNNTGGYFCEASNSLGVFSNSTPVQLLVRPSIVEYPMMQMVYPGVTASFGCRAEGFSELSYSWFVVTANADSGLEIENETNTTYIVPNPTYSNNASGYYCIASNNEGVAVSNTSVLTVLLPTITDITIFPIPRSVGILLHQFNDSVSLTCTAEGGPRIMTRWQFDDGSTVANGSSSVTYNVSLLSTDHTGVYYCVAIIDGMTVTSMNYTLFVAPYEVEITGAYMYSQGEQLMLNCLSEGGPELEYTWLFSGSVIPNANTSTLVINNVNTTRGGDYTCNVTNDAGFDSDMITVYIGVVITTHPQDELVNVSDSVNFTCEASGSLPINYRWLYNGSYIMNDPGHIEGVNTSTLMIVNVNVTDWGMYSCEASNTVDNATSNEAKLYVAPYEVEITGANMYSQGEQLMLNCSSEGGPELEYTWLFSGSMIPNANTSTLIINNVNTTDGGNYTCNVTNAAGFDSDMITVYIGVVIITHPQDELVNVSDSVNFTCEASGSLPINYRWLYNGSYIMNDPGHIEGVNTSTLMIVNVNVTDWGIYSCEASNIVDNGTSNEATLYVSPLGTVDVTPNDMAVDHMTSSVTFTCQSMAGPNLNYTWFINGSSEALSNDNIVVNDFQLTVNNVTYLLGGRYTCVVTNPAGQGEDSSDLFVNPFIVTDPQSQRAVEADIVNFTCIAVAFPAPVYNWSTPIPNMDFNTSTITIVVDYSYFGNYTCFAESNGTITTSLPALLTVSPEGSIEISPVNINTTFNSTVIINCEAEGGPNNMFQWRKQGVIVSNNSVLEFPSITGSDGAVYECIVSNAVGNDTENVTLTVAPYNATITETVDNNDVTYTCNAEGGPGNTYEWLRLRDNATVSMTQELTLDNTDPLDGGEYQCTITNAAGNTSAMTTHNVATVIVTSPQTQNVTAGESFTLMCNATGYPVPSIEWMLNGTSYIIRDSSITTITLTEGLRSNTSNLTVTSAMTNDTGIYECVAINEVNTDTQDANVTVQNCPDEPINVQIFNVNSRNLTINWTEPHNNNDPITQYNISYQNPACLVDAGIAVQNVTITSIEEQVMINDLYPGEYYTFTIIAINSICPSQPSLPASMRTLEEVPGAAPVVSTNANQQSINVSWMMLDCQDRHGNITMYEVHYTSTDFGENIDQTLNTSNGDELSLEVDGLEEFANYTIEVRAYTAIGPGPYSDSMDVQTLPDIPSGSVTNLNPVNVTATSVELIWGPVNARDQNGIILLYRIYYRLISDDSYSIINVTARNRNISDLMENETYIFAVTAVNQVGESMVNASVMVQTNESAPSTPPENVMISNVTDGDDIAVNITWDPPTDPNGIIRYYRVEFVQDSDPLDNGPGNTNCPPLDNTIMNMFANITSGSSGAPTYTNLSRLVAYRMYNYSIFAATSVGEGPSADGSFLTREDTPLAPENLTVNIPGVARNSTTLLVNWERPLCDRGVLSGYELCYVESSVGDCDSNGIIANITDPDQLSYTINGLSINTNYTVMLRGRTGAGLDDPAIANGTTDEDAPAPVMNIVTQFSPNNSNTTRGYYNITWTPPAPTNGSFYQILEYSYSSAYSVGPMYNGSFSTSYLDLDQNQNQFMFVALYYTDYNFTITTINIKYNITNGPARHSNQSSPAVPTAVRDIKVAMSTPESIYITWDHPEYPNSQLLNYIFYYNATMLQSRGEISTDGFEDVTLAIVTSHNLTGLSSFINYTILITVTGRDVDDAAPFEVEILHRTNASVPTELPTLPTTITPLPPVTTDTITILLPPPEQIMTGIVEEYAVIVVTGDLLRAPRVRRNTDNPLSSPRDIIRNNGDVLPDPYDPENPMDLYTAAVWTNPDEVPVMFVVGSGSTTTVNGVEYVNTELAEGTEYGVFNYIRLESDDGNPGPLLVDDDYLAVTSTGVTPEETNGGAIAAGVIVPLIVIAAIIIAVIVFIWYYRRHRYTKHDLYTGEVAYTESENVVLNPVAPQPYLGTFQPIPVTEFRNHVNKMHADSDYRFSEEYAAVEPEHSPTTEATLAPSNTNKNRYANISAYDHSRVRLRVQSDDETDYINGNYIDGYKRKNAYIATQGPVPDTFISFWRMVWECESQTIIMLTNLEEKGRVKCHQYWPDDRVKVPGNIRVATLEQLELAEYTVRTFSLKREGSKEERIVKQFHYTTWPDFGVPTHPTPVLRFTRRILASDHQDAGPIIVHCSAGVGRSGTFITLHSQLQRISSEGTIDIFPFVRQMRYRRCHMVQTEPQYVFIHDALLEAIECGETEVMARDLKGQYRKLTGPSDDDRKKQLIEEEFKRIDDSIHISGDHTSGQTPANKAKNRYANVLPYDGSRCRISAIPGQEGSDYINASYIDGYLKQKAYVATQGPLPDTAAEFWRMIWELKCATIVMLVKEREQGRVKCHHYWPDTGAETFGQYQVVAHSCNEYAEYTLREFNLVDKKDNSSLPVRHFQFTSWPENGTVPDNSSGLIDLIGQVQKWQQNSGNKPITVHCSGGSGRTGTYIAISILLDRLKVEGVVDVFQTVRGLRLQRMHMVQTLAQYEFCYTTVLEFLDSFELYSNFK